MAHIKKLNFLKNHKDLVDENYGMVAVPTFSDKMDKDLAELFKSQNKTGKVGDLVFEIDNNSRIVYYGLGDSSEKTAENFRRAAGEVVGYALQHKYSDIAVECPVTDEGEYFCQAFAEGLILSSYRFLDYFTDERGEYHLKSITMVDACNQDAAKKGAIIASAVCDSRDLGNHPGNVTTPTRLANFAKEVGKKGNMKVTVFDREEFTKMGMGSFAGVAQGTNEPPKFIIMEYYGGKKSEKPVLLVGKGLTFDTGGVSLKPGLNMDQMKFDMCGSAVVFGVMNAIAELQPQMNVVAIVPSTHNMLGGSAYKPGDILTAYNGKTIEVLNTDAEGRLVLADALTFTEEKFKPSLIVDLATLTGAIIVALGSEYAGLWSNSEKLSKQLFSAGEQVEEKVWRMPLHENYNKLMNSKTADMQNINYVGGAGSTTAAQFLQRFIMNNTPWAHLDIAGMAFSKYAGALNSGGATGYGVRLLNKFIEENYE